MRVLHFCLLTILLILSACASIDKGMMEVSNAVSSPDPVTGQRQINLVSEDEEVRKAEDATKQILTEARNKGIKIDSDTPYYTRVTDVFNKLKNVVHRKHLPWEVHVIESEQWNAFTIGGGKMFVFSGIFQSEVGLKTDDELAAVLAHEMAHVTARHVSEGAGKLAIAKLADKNLRDNRFDASFTTIQEDEADKYSVIYSALAGYDPAAGITIWKRMHDTSGSYTGNMLYDHPLNDDRSRNMEVYAGKARQYYIPREINPDHESLLLNNTVFSHNASQRPKAGEGGGFLSLLEAVANTTSEVLSARTEQTKREIKQSEQEREASTCLLFRELQIAYAQGGGLGLFGTAINPSGYEIKQAFVVVEYLSGQSVLFQEKTGWSPMSPYEKRKFGIPLKQIKYDCISIRPVYVQLSGE